LENNHLETLREKSNVGADAPEVTSEKPGNQTGSDPHRGGPVPAKSNDKGDA
jgi:hypothetical protein